MSTINDAGEIRPLTNEEAYALDTADTMAELGALMHKAEHLARRLEARGVDMFRLELPPETFKALRDAAENAYTLGKV